MATILDFKLEQQKIRDLYKSSPTSKKLHLLLMGDSGSGKTQLIATAPGPIWIHSFDPQGTITVQEEIDSGKIIADTRFEVDDINAPTAYLAWQNEFNRMKHGKIFDNVGTYVIDSFTTMTNSLVWQIMKKEGRTPPGIQGKMDDSKHGMRIQDWGTLLNMIVMLSRHLAALPCNTILTGHVDRGKNTLEQITVRGLLCPGQGKDHLPINMSECWILQSIQGKRHILTANEGEYTARTRIGRKGLFKAHEPEPNIANLLKRAGYPWEDK